MQNGEARAYDSHAGMVDDTLFSVLDDRLGSLWVGSGRGIGRIRKSEFSDLDRGAIPSLNCMTFGSGDGLLSASSSGGGTPLGASLADGRIMLATDRGMAVIDPHSLQVNSQPPTVLIESVVADDRTLPSGPAISVPAGVNRLEIRYTALSLVRRNGSVSATSLKAPIPAGLKPGMSARPTTPTWRRAATRSACWPATTTA